MSVKGRFPLGEKLLPELEMVMKGRFGESSTVYVPQS